MAKPRIFISSTFYDLRQTRVDLDQFIESLGYEPVRNEEGDIPYGKDKELQEYCYKEISNIDILVSIVGSRYGSTSTGSDNYSVSQKEVKTAIENHKQVFIFIDKRVLTEFETYLLNKSNPDVQYNYVDNTNIYKFIEEIKNLTRNNNIKEFESAQDITRYLREQFAGLFKQYIDEQERAEENLVIRDIRDTAKTLHNLVEYLKEDNSDKQDEINKIIRVNHPLVTKLKAQLGVKYNFFVEGVSDLSEFLKARGFQRVDDSCFNWVRNSNKILTTITISGDLFDNGKLVYLNPSDWDESMLVISHEEIPQKPIDDDDLPF